MSEIRRAAKALVGETTERFESVHGLEASRERLEAALARARLAPDATFECAWSEQAGKAVLEARFKPDRRTRRLLQLLSLALLALVAASAWILRRPGEGAERFLLPLFTALAILGLPLLTLGMASTREARESRIRRAIRASLLDDDQA